MSVAKIDVSQPPSEETPDERPVYRTGLMARENIAAFCKKHLWEPLLFLLMMGFLLKAITFQNLVLERTCTVSMGINASICEHLENYDTEKRKVQQYATTVLALCGIVMSLPGAVGTMFFGPWSDIYGRKIVLALSLFGLLLESIGVVVYSLLSHLGPYESLIFLLPSGIFGGMMTGMTTCYSSVTDSSGSAERSTRFVGVEFAALVGVPFGMYLGGVIFKFGGYLWVFGTTTCLYCLSLLWVFFLINETLPSAKPLSFNRESIKIALQDLGNVSTILNNFRTCVKPRPYNFRKQIWLLICANTVLSISFLGTTVFNYSFTQQQLNWNVSKHSTYQALLHLLQAVTVVVMVPLLTKHLVIREGVLGFLGSISMAFEMFIKAVSSKEGVYVLAYVVGALGGAGSVASRTRISKIVRKRELGKIFSVLALFQSVIPLLAGFVFSQVYRMTLNTFPGTAYMAIFVLLGVPMVIFWWLYLQGPIPVGIESDLEESTFGNDFERFDNFIGETKK